MLYLELASWTQFTRSQFCWQHPKQQSQESVVRLHFSFHQAWSGCWPQPRQCHRASSQPAKPDFWFQQKDVWSADGDSSSPPNLEEHWRGGDSKFHIWEELPIRYPLACRAGDSSEGKGLERHLMAQTYIQRPTEGREDHRRAKTIQPRTKGKRISNLTSGETVPGSKPLSMCHDVLLKNKKTKNNSYGEWV